MGNMLDMSIHEYAEAGDYEGIKEYVREGGNVMKRDFFNNTALHRSASMGFTTITRFLLDEGAEVDATAKDGWYIQESWPVLYFHPRRTRAFYQRYDYRTPLHLACRWGRVGAIRELVAAGADVEKKTGDGRTPGELLKPEMTDSERNEIVKLLGCRPRRGRPASPGEVEDE